MNESVFALVSRGCCGAALAGLIALNSHAGDLPRPGFDDPQRLPAGAVGEDAVLADNFWAPPGTLGRTYLLPSRPVPANKHPRVAMIDVCCATAEHIIVRWTNDFRTEETLKGTRDERNPSLWHFESKPLVPGLSQIYRVEIYNRGPGCPPDEVRYVRLIMGRVVFLTV